MAYAANAATYNCGMNCTSYSDDDYVYFTTSNRAYNCGGYAYTGYTNEVNVRHGETLITSGASVYYCCDNGMGSDGYWITFPSETKIKDHASACPERQIWVSLGDNKYCQARQTGIMEWCAGHNSSGILNYEGGGECVYSGSCSTVTHCGQGYYKDGSSCKPCPDGGTTRGYTERGQTECFLPAGTPMSDITGTYTCSSNAGYVI